MIASISARGKIALDTVLRPDFEIYFQAAQNVYHRDHNPKGDFPLNVADNKLNWHMLREKLQQISATEEIPEWVSGYASGLGHENFIVAIAEFVGTFLSKCTVEKEYIGIAAGATAVIELSAWILANAGDVAVFPVPSYPVYSRDIGNKAGIERYDLVTHHSTEDIRTGPLLSVEDLERAKKDIEQEGKTFKMLILTNPDNPTGGVFSQTQLKMFAQWCIENEIHLIVNEIYGLSLLNIDNPVLSSDYISPNEFASFIPIIREQNSPFLHHWYALSKDIGVSGLRVGMVYSRNQDFLKAFGNLSLPHLVSNHTQWLLGKVLEDTNFMGEFIKEHRKAMTDAYIVVITTLRQLDIPYFPSIGSLFIWADFSKFVHPNDQKSENLFWSKLYEGTGILLTPGDGFGHSKRGMFRIVYTCFEARDLQVAMVRLKRYFHHLNI